MFWPMKQMAYLASVLILAHARQQEFLITELFDDLACSSSATASVLHVEAVSGCQARDVNGDWIPDVLVTVELNASHLTENVH